MLSASTDTVNLSLRQGTTEVRFLAAAPFQINDLRDSARKRF